MYAMCGDTMGSNYSIICCEASFLRTVKGCNGVNGDWRLIYLGMT